MAKILGIWAAVTLPMTILGWVVYPALAPDFEADPLGAAAVRMGAIKDGAPAMTHLSSVNRNYIHSWPPNSTSLLPTPNRPPLTPAQGACT